MALDFGKIHVEAEQHTLEHLAAQKVGVNTAAYHGGIVGQIDAMKVVESDYTFNSNGNIQFNKWTPATTEGEDDMNTDNRVLENPLQYLREQLDADTLILRKAGLESVTGRVTERGKEAVLQDLYDSKRATLADRLRAAIKDDEAAENGDDTVSLTE